MYFINPKIVKSIANEVYRDAGYGVDKATDYYVIYDDNNANTVAFKVNKEYHDLANKYDHYCIEFINDFKNEPTYNFYSTETLNRRELADKLLEIISRYEYLKEVSAWQRLLIADMQNQKIS